MHQEIRYCTASDGVRLAYSIIGKGKPIVRTPHWFAHLEYDLKGPIFRHQILGLAHSLKNQIRESPGAALAAQSGASGVFTTTDHMWRGAMRVSFVRT